MRFDETQSVDRESMGTQKAVSIRNASDAESPACSETAEEIPRVFRRNRAHVRNATVCVKPRENVRVDRISS